MQIAFAHARSLPVAFFLTLATAVHGQFEPLDVNSLFQPFTGLFYPGEPLRITVDAENQPVCFGNKGTDLPIDWRSLYLRGLPTGVPDSTFDGEGFVFHNVCTSIERALGVACTSDGKIVGMGQEDYGGFDDDGIFVQRLNHDGSPDSTFWEDGKFIFQFNGEYTQGKAMDRFSDDAIVVTGLNNNYNTFLVKLLANGELDPTFGSGGVGEYGVGDELQDEPADLCALPDGSTIVMGWYRPYLNAPKGLFVSKVLPDGTIDANYGNGGSTLLSSEEEFWLPQRIALADDGSVYVASDHYDAMDEQHLLVQHFLADGTYDTSFGVNGLAYVPEPIGTNSPYARAIGVLPGGWVVVTAGSESVMLACLFPNGQPVQNFGDNGVFELEYFQEQLTNKDLAVDHDGNVWVCSFADGRPLAYKILIDVSVGTIDHMDGGHVPTFLGSVVTGDELLLEWDLHEPAHLNVELLNCNGQTLGVLWSGDCVAGAQQRSFALPKGMAPGAYLLRFNMQHGFSAVRFIKQ